MRAAAAELGGDRPPGGPPRPRDRIEGDPVGGGLRDQAPHLRGGVEVERVERHQLARQPLLTGSAHPVAVLAHPGLDQGFGGSDRHSVADIEHCFPPAHAGQGVDEPLQRLHRGQHSLVAALGHHGDLLRQPLRFVDGGIEGVGVLGAEAAAAALAGLIEARGLDLSHQEAVLDVHLDSATGAHLHAVERLDQQPDVVGEALFHPRLGTAPDQHHPIRRVAVALQIVAQVVEDPVAILGPDVELVDEDHQLQALGLGPRQRGGLVRRLVFSPHLALLDGEEVGQLHRLAVFEQREVVAGEAGHRVAVLVGHHHLDVDDVDVDRVEEEPGLGLGGRAGDPGQDAQQENPRRKKPAGWLNA